MRSRSDWKQNMLKVNKLSVENNLYVNKLESDIFGTKMCILQTRTYWKVGTLWD